MKIVINFFVFCLFYTRIHPHTSLQPDRDTKWFDPHPLHTQHTAHQCSQSWLLIFTGIDRGVGVCGRCNVYRSWCWARVKGTVNLFNRSWGFLPVLWKSPPQSIAHYCVSSRSSEGKENKGHFLWKDQPPNELFSTLQWLRCSCSEVCFLKAWFIRM